MKIPDVNVLVNAVNDRSDDHQAANVWLSRALSGRVAVGFDWITLVGFVRLVTMRRLFDEPLPIDVATGLVRDWLDRPSSVVVTPGSRHIDVMEDLLKKAGRAGNLTNDAHLAALAVEQRAEVVTFDSDFARFPGVRWVRPTLEQP